MSQKFVLQPLKGFRDYLPEQMIMRSRAIQTIREVFERFGFVPLDTPTLEYADVLLGKYGPEAEKLMYRFRDHGDRDVCMRYDLTVPLARVVAQYPELPRPFRRYQVATVWRGENTSKGRYREFVQCDVDIVGTTSLLADLECIWVAHEVMHALGIHKFSIRISHRKLLEGLAVRLGRLEPARFAALFRAVDKLEKQGEEKVRAELQDPERAALNDEQAAAVFEFLRVDGALDEKLDRLQAWFGGEPAGSAGVAALRELVGHAKEAGLHLHHLALDQTIARGLDYYTGPVFETFLEGVPGLGSVMSGGRYDGLIGFFANQELPAVGISVGLDRLFAGMEELKLVKTRGTTAQVLVTMLDACLVPRYLQLAGELRRAGVPTELYYQADSLGKQLQYADRRGIPLAIIVGESEMARGVAAVKRLREKRQEEVPLAGLAGSVRNWTQNSTD